MAAAPYTHDGRVCIRDLMMSSNKVYMVSHRLDSASEVELRKPTQRGL